MNYDVIEMLTDALNAEGVKNNGKIIISAQMFAEYISKRIGVYGLRKVAKCYIYIDEFLNVNGNTASTTIAEK